MFEPIAQSISSSLITGKEFLETSIFFYKQFFKFKFIFFNIKLMAILKS